jgi:hypothetical protein
MQPSGVVQRLSHIEANFRGAQGGGSEIGKHVEGGMQHQTFVSYQRAFFFKTL